MISDKVSELLLEKQEHYIIPAEKVANVMAENPLSHALLVLTRVGYSRIPVLDKQDHLVGMLSLSQVVAAMFTTETIEPEKLDGLTVADVMDRELVWLEEELDVEKILNLLVDHSFLPVLDQQQRFKGILTRKEMLKGVNHLVHTLEIEEEVSL